MRVKKVRSFSNCFFKVWRLSLLVWIPQCSNAYSVNMRRPSPVRCESFIAFLFLLRDQLHKSMGRRTRTRLAFSFFFIMYWHCFLPLNSYSADGNATLICKICGQSFSCRTHALMAPIDVYSEWIDATEEVNGWRYRGKLMDETTEDKVEELYRLVSILIKKKGPLLQRTQLSVSESTKKQKGWEL